MKRKHRHELKQNEFLVWLEQTMDWLQANKKNLITTGSAVVAAVALIAGITYYRESRASSAQARLNEALDLFHASVQESSVVQSAEGPNFKSEEERYRAALDGFDEVIRDYSGMEQGRRARYYAALCHQGLGDLDAAQKLLEEVVADNDRTLMHYLSNQVLAAVKAQKGDLEGAAEIYRMMVEDPKTPLPKDQLLFNLARVKEEEGKLEEARAHYQRVLEEYPDSFLRAEVTERNDLIEYRLKS